MIFRSPLPKLHYYHNKRLQAKNPKYLTNLQLNPYPNTQLDLFCSDSSLFWCTAPMYVANQLRGSQYATSITNLKRLLAAKFFSSSTQWRSGRFLVTKPYGVNTQQLLQERDELGQEFCLRSQFAWTKFAQYLCNLCTVWWLLKQSFYMSRVRRKESPKTISRIPRKSDRILKFLNFDR